jgi:flagellar protein FliS
MGFQQYQQMDINTTSPTGLIVKLYEGAIRQARVARAHQEAGRIAERGRAIAKAMAIVSELASALDMERGGEIATNLNALYAFVNERLVDANLRGQVAPIDEAVGILATLAEAWVEIARGSEALEARAS